MASTSQLATMRERVTPAPASPPQDARQPTNASLPILSPPHHPAPASFTAPPAGLTPAQKAVHTRQARAAGIMPAKADPAGKAKPSLTPARPDTLSLVLTLSPLPAGDGKASPGLAVSFAHRTDGKPADLATIPEGERTLRFLSAQATRGASGELEPATGLVFTGTASANEIEAVLPLMRSATASLCRAYEDSEDPSFPQMVLTLAGIYRVDRVEFTPPGGELVSAKRGAAYITAFKASEAFKAG